MLCSYIRLKFQNPIIIDCHSVVNFRHRETIYFDYQFKRVIQSLILYKNICMNENLAHLISIQALYARKICIKLIFEVVSSVEY